MLNNISNEDLILNNPLIQQQNKVSGLDKKSTSTNPYSKASDLGDVIDISAKAKELCEKDKEIEKYKSMVMDMLNKPDTPEQTESILNSVKSGDYISNDAIAEKMLNGSLSLNGSDLLKILLSHPEAQEEIF